MGSTTPLAPDFDSGPRWWLNDATTSSASSGLPLWKVTPRRSLKTQVLASFDGSTLSASSPTSFPSGPTSIRLLYTAPQRPMFVKLDVPQVAGLWESLVLAPLSPRRKRPPFRGPPWARAVAGSAEARVAAAPP